MPRPEKHMGSKMARRRGADALRLQPDTGKAGVCGEEIRQRKRQPLSEPRRYSPLFPPLLRSSCRLRITMDLSTALHMS